MFYDQNMSWLMFFFILITRLLDVVRRNKNLIKHSVQGLQISHIRCDEVLLFLNHLYEGLLCCVHCNVTCFSSNIERRGVIDENNTISCRQLFVVDK